MGDFTITELSHNQFRMHIKAPFEFKQGGAIPESEFVYETYGKLNADKSNVIVINHALSTNSHVASHSYNDEKGWWENMVGPGAPIDSQQYFIICINNLGSCFGSSGPCSLHPNTGKAYQRDFPHITMTDIARSQRLVLNKLGIDSVHAIIGSSMAGMISLCYAIDYPGSVQHLVLISSCYRAYPANIANRLVQREIIQLDPAWCNGDYETNPIQGLKIARKLGHFTYRNPAALNEKFQHEAKDFETEKKDVENYLEYNATKFVKRFDANSYLSFLSAMDHFCIEKTEFARLKAKTLVVAVDSDILFTPDQQHDLYEAIKAAGKNVKLIDHHSDYGHDAFLVETDAFGRYIKEEIG